MSIEDLQLQIEREKWPRYHAAQANTASTPASRRLAEDWANLKARGIIKAEEPAKASEAPPVAPPPPPGSQLELATQWAEQIRQARAAKAMREASSPIGAAHKLDRLIISG